MSKHNLAADSVMRSYGLHVVMFNIITLSFSTGRLMRSGFRYLATQIS